MEQQYLVRPKIVDSNEPGEIRMKLLETGWIQQGLYSGDYKFFTHDFLKVGITRKKVSDLLSSIGEVFSKQLEEMIDYYDIKIILIEGSWKWVFGQVLSSRGIEYFTRDMAWDYLHRWMAKGFILELTTNEGDTIHRLNRLYALYQKLYSLSANTRKFADDRILALPSGVRGATGMKVLERFGSLRNIANASREELLQVEKIGDKKSQLIYQHFNRRNNA